jgi:hypothetical protein
VIHTSYYRSMSVQIIMTGTGTYLVDEVTPIENVITFGLSIHSLLLALHFLRRRGCDRDLELVPALIDEHAESRCVLLDLVLPLWCKGGWCHD